MIQEAYAALCQEPWCFTPDQVSRLTDWQMLELYFLPAVRRAKDLKDGSEKESAVATPAAAPSGGGSEIPNRELFVATAMTLRMDRATAEAQYDRQLAAHLARQKGSSDG